MPLRPTPYESWSGGYIRVDGRDIRANTAYMWGHILAATDIRISTEFDSVLSSTAGIQEAIDDLPATGGMVFIPAGTHAIRGTVDIDKSNVQIVGAGKGVTILQRVGSVSSAITENINIGDDHVHVADASGFSVGDSISCIDVPGGWRGAEWHTITRIEGNILYIGAPPVTTTWLHPYLLANAAEIWCVGPILYSNGLYNDITIRDLTTHGNRLNLHAQFNSDYALALIYMVTDHRLRFTLMNAIVTDCCQDSVMLSSDYMDVLNCRFINGGRNSAHIAGSQYIHIEGCTFDSPVWGAMLYFCAACQDVIVEGCNFRNAPATGAAVMGIDNIADKRYIFKGNTFDQVYYGFLIYGGPTDITIIDNIFYRSTQYPIKVYGTGGLVPSDFNISNNQFIETNYGYTGANDAAIELEGVQHSIVAGNQFYGHNAHLTFAEAIRAEISADAVRGHSLVIRDNIINGINGAGNAINISGCDNVEVMGNVLNGLNQGVGILVAAGATGVSMRNNKVLDFPTAISDSGTGSYLELVSTDFADSGTTTAGIQEAIDSLPATGGEVIIPPGTHSISTTISVTGPDVKLRGCGNASLLYLANGSNVDVISFTAAALRFEACHFSIEGNKAAQAAGSGIVGANPLNAHIHHVYVAHCKQHGIKITRTASDPEENRIANCHVHGCDGNGIFFETFVVDSSVVECVCNNNNNGIYLQGGNRNLVEGNNVRWSVSDGIVIEDEETVVSDNICSFNQAGHGIYVNTAGSAMILNNTVNGNHRDGIRIYRSSRCHVTNNHCYDQGDGWSNIHIEGDGVGAASFNTIRGNECFRFVAFSTDWGIRILGGANAEGNRLFDNVSTDHDVADLEDAGLNTVYGHNRIGWI